MLFNEELGIRHACTKPVLPAVFSALLSVTFLVNSLTATAQLTITANTTNLCQGQSLTFAASGVPANTSIRWYKDGSFINGATSPTYITTQTGTYKALSGFLDQTISGVSDTYKDVHFVNSTTGWLAFDDCNGAVRKTTDGGTTWTLQTPGSGCTIGTANAIHFTDVNNGWIVTNNGYIRRTANGGTSWTAQTSPTTQPLRDVFMLNATTGWAVGGNGVIIRTTDGTTWAAQTSSVSVYLLGVHFVNGSVGWAVGGSGTILKTTNGGTTWTTQTSNTTNFLTDVWFTDAGTGWVVGNNGTILKTTDGGTTWTTQTNPAGTSLNDVQFADANTGWAVGSGNTFLYTTNAGATWTAQGADPYGEFTAISVVNTTTAWTVGNNPAIIKGIKTELSNSLVVSAPPAAPTLSASPATPVSPGTNVILSGAGCTGTLAWSTGSSATSITVNPQLSTTYSATCVQGSCRSSPVLITVVVTVPLTPGSLCAGQPISLIPPNPNANDGTFYQGFYWQRNGVAIPGTTSMPAYQPMQAGDYEFISDIYSIRANTQTVASVPTISASAANICPGQSPTLTATGTTADALIQWQRNGVDIPLATGSTYAPTQTGQYNAVAQTSLPAWNRQGTAPPSSGGSEVFTFDANTSWILQRNTTTYLHRTLNGGASFTTANINNSLSYSGLNDFFFASATTGWIVGYNGCCNSVLGFIAKTTNGGDNWTIQTNNLPMQPRSVFFLNETTGWAAGFSTTIPGGTVGRIYRTTNGGTTWTAQSTDLSYIEIYNVFFINSTTGWATGGNPNGLILKTTDGGVTWATVLSVPGTSYFNSTFFIDANTGWVVTNYNAPMMRTTNGGATWTALPDQYGSDALGSVFFTDALNGWSSGNSRNTNLSRYSLYRTTNGGVTWKKYDTPDFAPVLSRNGFFGVADNGNFYKYVPAVTACPSNAIAIGNSCCTSMVSVKDGNWNDPTVWSCGRLPTLADPIQVKHTVTIPASYTAQAQRVGFDAGKKIVYATSGQLRVGL